MLFWIQKPFHRGPTSRRTFGGYWHLWFKLAGNSDNFPAIFLHFYGNYNMNTGGMKTFELSELITDKKTRSRQRCNRWIRWEFVVFFSSAPSEMPKRRFANRWRFHSVARFLDLSSRSKYDVWLLLRGSSSVHAKVDPSPVFQITNSESATDMNPGGNIPFE